MARRPQHNPNTSASSVEEEDTNDETTTPTGGLAARPTPSLAEPSAGDWKPPRAVEYTKPEELLPARSASADDPDLPYWLALSRVKGIGPARFRMLLDAFGTAEAAWTADPAEWQQAGMDTRTASSFEQQRRRIVPDAERERLERQRIVALRVIDSAYPRLLREIPLPPPILYVRGALTADDDLTLAIVGTRRASAYGRQVTERIASELVA